MEELQEALEDARYVHAINFIDGPRPITAWEDPSEDTLSEWRKKKITDYSQNSNEKLSSQPFSFEWILKSTLGFYMFSEFVKDAGEHYFHMNFIENVLRLRRSVGLNRGKLIREMYELSRCIPKRNGETGLLIIPKKKRKEGNDLVYNNFGSRLSTDELISLTNSCIDHENQTSSIGLKGQVLNEITSAIEALLLPEDDFILQEDEQSEISLQSKSLAKSKPIGNKESLCETQTMTTRSDSECKMNITESSIRNLCALDEYIFDKAEQIVMEFLCNRYWSSFQASPEWKKFMNYLWHQDKHVVDEDFFLMRVLGRGGFGLVNACKKGTTGALYAMKVMSKKRLKHKKSVQFALNERACLAAVNSPFVVSLKYAFQTKDDLYLILDLMTGGDLAFHLEQQHRFSHEICIYYAARIMLGLQALHDKNYVFRDLKPENLLLAEDGRIRLTDLGLATQVVPDLHGAAGTRGYWAPEMLLRNTDGKRMSYDQRVDWFSYGCVVAEMITGCNPFRTECALDFGMKFTDTKEHALDYSTVHYNPTFESKRYTETSVDLCKKLLDKNPNTRLGCNGCKEIMKHPWFNEVNWDDIISDKQKPPFVPSRDINAAPQSEIGTFAEDKNVCKLTDEDQECYKDWDYKNDDVFATEVINMLIYEKETGVPLVPLVTKCCCSIS